MPTSRRDFLHLLGVNSVAAATWRPSSGCHPRSSARRAAWRRRPAGSIRLSSNENSHGPGPAVLEAIQGAFPRVNRYSFAAAGDVQSALARKLGVQPEQVTLGCGSSEILDAAVIAFTTPERGVVTASPTFELVGDLARHMSHPVVEVPVTETLGLDLAQMADKAAGAGLIYICNPNNPTGTLHGGKAMEEFITRRAEARAEGDHPRRRGVPRVRRAGRLQERDSDRVVGAARRRVEDLLEDLRHRRPSLRVRRRAPGLDPAGEQVARPAADQRADDARRVDGAGGLHASDGAAAAQSRRAHLHRESAARCGVSRRFRRKPTS